MDLIALIHKQLTEAALDAGPETIAWHFKLVDGLHVRVINAVTGELLRELTIDPDRNYQPLGRPPGPAPKRSRPDPSSGSGLSGIS